MAKRFTDTDKWKKPFVRGLDAKYKLLWFYILDDCDHAGVWIVDLEVAGLRCGFDYNEKETLKTFDGQVRKINGGGYWFVQDFIEFQYGELNPSNRAHNSVLNILKKYKIKPLTSPLQGAKDKVKDKEKDKDKDKEPHFQSENLNATFLEFIEHRKQMGEKMTPLAITKMTTKLSKLSEQVAIAQLNQSIENGWKGVFELKVENKETKHHDFSQMDYTKLK
jgi:hypothetical protein